MKVASSLPSWYRWERTPFPDLCAGIILISLNSDITYNMADIADTST